MTYERSTVPEPSLQIGDWAVDALANELRRGGETVRLEQKVMELLLRLVRSAGQVVSREELLAAVWPGVVVGDDALTQAVIKLRRALGDVAYQPRYIETISKRGYRLIAPVQRLQPGEGLGRGAAVPATPPPSPEAQPLPALGPAPAVTPIQTVQEAGPKPGWRGRRQAGWVLAGVAALALAWFVAGRVDPPRQNGPPGGSDSPVSSAAPPIVAVLPLSEHGGQGEYFSGGLTEDLIHALGRHSGLRVISRRSVDQFKQRTASLREIRDALGARYIVSGSVRSADGKLRIAIELSDADLGIVLMSEQHDGVASDLFAFQDRIVLNITGALAGRLSRLEQRRAQAKAPQALEAYDLVLRARALLENAERAANRQAREALVKAAELEPGYAEIYVLQSVAEVARAVNGWVEEPDSSIDLAEKLARQALHLDTNSRAHGQLGRVLSVRADHVQALAEIDRALELNPSDADALDWRGAALMWLGRFDEALVAMELSLRYDPTGYKSGGGFDRCMTYYMLGRYDEAATVAKAAIARHPNLSFLYVVQAMTLAELGRDAEARSAAAQVHRLDPFFQGAEFGNRFANPRHRTQVQQGLRRAGL